MVQEKTNIKFSLGSRRRRKLLVSGFFAFFVIFAISYVAGSEIMAASGSHAAEIAAAISNAGGDTISITSSQRISTNIAASVDGTVVAMKDTLNIQSSATTGYSIYLSANDDGNKMCLESDSSCSRFIRPVGSDNNGTLSDPDTSWDIPIILAANTWGYAIPGVNNFNSSYSVDEDDRLIGATDRKFAAVPLRGKEQKILSASTATSGSGTNYDIYYGVNADTSLDAGTYSTTVIYSAITESTTSDRAMVSPDVVRSLSGGDEITITTNLMALASDVQTAATTQGVPMATVTIGDADCTNIRLSNSTGNNLVIKCYTPAKATGTYDIRVSIPSYSKNYFISNGLAYTAPETTVFGISYMQDMTPAICAAVPTPNSNATETSTSLERIRSSVNQSTGKASLVAEAILTDNRDNKQYIVRKMPDGQCWMSQNLDLDLTVKDTNGQFATASEGKTGQVYAKKLNSTDVTPLTSDNTDISNSSWTISGNNIGYATQTAVGTVWNNYGRNGSNNSTYEVRSYDPGDECRANNGSNSDTGADVTITPCTQPSTSHVGNRYNWPAATAGSGTYALSTQYTNVYDSICPKGWDLPTGVQSGPSAGQFGTLLLNIDGIYTATTYMPMTAPMMWAITNAPYSIVRAGIYRYSDGAASLQGSDSDYWSSTVDNQKKAYSFSFTSDYISPGTYSDHKGLGFSVRCVAQGTYNYSLSYNLNGGSDGPSTQNGATTGAVTLTVPKTEPTRTNMVFLGWADSKEDADNYKVTHRLYDDSEKRDGTGSNKITLTASNPNKTLYAVWADSISNSTSLTSCKASGTASGTTYTVADPRDRKLYYIRKMPDGQCWMVQNLDLDIAMSSTTMGTTNTVTNDFVAFSSTNTDISTTNWKIVSPNAGYATQTSDQVGSDWTWGSAGKNKDAAAEEQDNSYEVRSYDPGNECWINNGNNTDNIGTGIMVTDLPCTQPSTTHVGNFYNWPAATAGSGTYAKGTQYTNVYDSICPKGWDLPTGTQSGPSAGQLGTLLLNIEGISSATSSRTIMTAPIMWALTNTPYNFIRAGYYSYGVGAMGGRGTDAVYWLSTAVNPSNAYSLGFVNGFVYPGMRSNDKSLGNSIRCIAQKE